MHKRDIIVSIFMVLLIPGPRIYYHFAFYLDFSN